MSEQVQSLPQSDPLVESVGRAVNFVFGPDRFTRARTATILLCAVMYAICCGVALYASTLGAIRPFAPQWLLVTSLPAYALFFWLVRSGRTGQLKDPGLMMPQHMFAMLSIAFAYTAVGPKDRGVVLILIALVMMFGMYTRTPKQSVAVGVGAMLLLGFSMGVLSRFDPAYYPFQQEMLRFELILGTIPSLIYCAHQISAWRDRLTTQRRDLKAALQRVQQLATHDVLTGLHNRRFMQERLESSVQRFDRYGERFTVVLVDLDHFKKINDQHGHRVGDEALRAFASAAEAVMRDTDTIARWGGEEFMFLLPNTSTHKALIAMQRLRQALADCPVCDTLPDLRVRFSAGVAEHACVDSLAHTLERADAALYRAKAEGRDRSAVAPPPVR